MTTVDDISDAINCSDWAAIIECDGCGNSGVMESSHEPRDETVWHCYHCDEETVHRTLLKSNDWRDVAE